MNDLTQISKTKRGKSLTKTSIYLPKGVLNIRAKVKFWISLMVQSSVKKTSFSSNSTQTTQMNLILPQINPKLGMYNCFIRRNNLVITKDSSIAMVRKYSSFNKKFFKLYKYQVKRRKLTPGITYRILSFHLEYSRE